MLFERIKKLRSKAEVTFFEIFRILRTIHSGEVEHEVRLCAVSVKILRSGIDVVFHDLIYSEFGETTILAVLYSVKLGAKVLANKPLGACC